MQIITKKVFLVSLALSLLAVGCVETFTVFAAPPSGSSTGDGSGVIRITGTFNNGAITLTSAPTNSLAVNSTGQLTVSGNLIVGTTPTLGSGKITAGTIDPPYTINGKGYATYLPSMTGVKEETAGVLKLTCALSVCKREIYFGTSAEGSDLWLFAKTTNLKNNFSNMVVLITPSFDGKVWYEKDPLRNKLTIFAVPANSNNNSPEVSYRLTAPRFDASIISNFRTDFIEVPGFIIND